MDPTTDSLDLGISIMSDLDFQCGESEYMSKIMNSTSKYDSLNLNFDDDIDSTDLVTESKNVLTFTESSDNKQSSLITFDESKKKIDELNNDIEKLFSSMARLQENNSVIILSSDDEDDEVTKQIDSIGIPLKVEAFISLVVDKSKHQKNQRFTTSTPKFNFNKTLKTYSRQENFEIDVLESVKTPKQTFKNSSAKYKFRFRSASTYQIQRIFKINGNPTESEKEILSKILSKSDVKLNLLTTNELIRKIELYIEGARYELNSFANLPQNRKVELLKIMKDGASLKEKMPDWCPI